MSQHVHQVAVVGAGPIGLELAVALKSAGIDYVHFDAKQIGHTMTWWAPQTRFFSSNERISIAGMPLLTPDQSKATREQYLTYLRTVVETFDLKVNTFEPVVDLQRGDAVAGTPFKIVTRPRTGERTWLAERVVLVTGGTDRPRKLGVPGEDLPHVSHYFGDPHQYFRQKVLIVGGKNSAIEAALRCHHAGARVALSYRGDGLPEHEIKYWLVPEMRGLIKTGRVPAYFNSSVTRITPAGAELLTPEGPKTVEADFVLLMTGYVQDNALLKCAGLELTGHTQTPTYDPDTMQTPIRGLYLAGTAVGGTQDKYRVFIENCHDHVDKIMRHAFGRSARVNRVVVDLPES